MLRNLSQGGREEIALALSLWKDFKCQGKFDPLFALQALQLADTLNVREEYDQLQKKLLAPFIIKIES